jgi:acetyl esterase/lipase
VVVFIHGGGWSDGDRLAVAGDSAGGNLAAVVSQLARDADGPRICFQLLWSPATTWDPSLSSFTENADAPILGRGALKGFSRWYAGDLDLSDMPATLAPARAEDLSGLPPAYIAVAGYAGVVPAATEAADRGLSALHEALHR